VKVVHVSGCGAAWLARLLGVQEVPGSNPGSPTKFLKDILLAYLLEKTTLVADCRLRAVSKAALQQAGHGVAERQDLSDVLAQQIDRCFCILPLPNNPNLVLRSYASCHTKIVFVSSGMLTPYRS
jgi:hypothetical protein